MSCYFGEKYFQKLYGRMTPLIAPPTETGCMEWLGSRDDMGYGKISFLGKIRLAHRLVWRLAHGDFPKLLLCHKCDNPSCVNLDHLFEGTQKDNMADCASKGRTNRTVYFRGVSHPNAKLNDEKVREIRRLRPNHTMKSIAAKFGVSRPLIGYVLNGSIWSHVPTEPPPADAKHVSEIFQQMRKEL